MVSRLSKKESICLYIVSAVQVPYKGTDEVVETYKSMKLFCCSMKLPIEEIAHEISSRYLTVTHRTNAGNLHFDVVIWEPIVENGFYKVRKNRERAQYI